MLTYADGSALSRSLMTGVESASWLRWSSEHSAELVTSPLGLTELRRAADGLDALAREKAHAIAEQITVVRFFDQSLKSAAMASTVLSPFAAIHLGIAEAHPDVGRVATYDPLLARVAIIYGLAVISPGRPDGWWEA
ncbi:type II toxin-antitoxin system VapC family toxin [Actinotalea subterranea]|uniref:type II toxin-antitoxin system VapC family toxin n=1 Tax=Actinotalea subterranea TaxID=2607497 RepID=UPI0011ED90EB|nr:type II toxin-antitoxin system VapC family toxin [Actinotalea subterranea]